MATFIALFEWTDQGIRNVKQTVERAENFKKTIEAVGGSVKDIYWTLGRFDGMIIFDAPDEATATAVMLGGCALGNVRTETLRAFDKKGMKEVLAKLPS